MGVLFVVCCVSYLLCVVCRMCYVLCVVCVVWKGEYMFVRLSVHFFMSG